MVSNLDGRTQPSRFLSALAAPGAGPPPASVAFEDMPYGECAGGYIMRRALKIAEQPQPTQQEVTDFRHGKRSGLSATEMFATTRVTTMGECGDRRRQGSFAIEDIDSPRLAFHLCFTLWYTTVKAFNGGQDVGMCAYSLFV